MLHIQKTYNKQYRYYRGSPPLLTIDPKGWFLFTDKDNDGYVHQEEIIISIFATLKPTNTQRMPIRRQVQDNWNKYDKKHRMKLNEKDFLKCGIVNFLIELEDYWKSLFATKKVSNTRKLRKADRKFLTEIPNIADDPRKWFEHYDVDHSMTLTQEEVIHGLNEGLTPATENEKHVIRETVENCWSTFDLDYGGTINKWEFLCKGGLADYLISVTYEWNNGKENRTTQHFMNLHILGSRRHTYMPPPSIVQTSNLEKWFEHFDIDYSGCLSQSELITGLFVTLNTITQEQRNQIREYVVSIWDTYDHNHNQVIEKDEFLGSNNLGEKLVQFAKDYDTENLLAFDKIAENSRKRDDSVKIKVYVPHGTQPGDMMQLASPISHEVVVLMVPEKIKWGGGEGDSNPFYFDVKFSRNNL